MWKDNVKWYILLFCLPVFVSATSHHWCFCHITWVCLTSCASCTSSAKKDKKDKKDNLHQNLNHYLNMYFFSLIS